MKKLLKYLIAVIVVAAFWNNADNNASSVTETALTDISTIECTHYSNISESQSEPCLPRQVSLTNAYRVQSAARRTTSVQRYNLEFIKAGKVVKTRGRNAIQSNFTNIRIYPIEPAQKLFYFGKLII